MSKRPVAKGKVGGPGVGTKSASAQVQAVAPWSSFLCSSTPLNNLKSQLRTSITKDITTYMNNPASHPDLTASQVTIKTTAPPPAVHKKGAKPVPVSTQTATSTVLTHKDGFEKAPLFQSSLVTVQTEMSSRIGGRGLVALQDIAPGTLLLCEYIRHPFQQGLVADDGTPIRPEVEFIQEFCFDMNNAQRVSLLVDFAPLFPFKYSEIEPDHRDFLLYVYGDLLAECLRHVVASSKHLITIPAHLQTFFAEGSKQSDSGENTAEKAEKVETIEITQELLLRFICIVHFNSFPSGMLLHTSMVNHNCQPNATKLFIPRQEIVNNSKQYAKISKTTFNPALYQPQVASQRVYSELRATTFIPKGDEIFISYIPGHLTDLTVDQRDSYLYRQFRFHCDCALCAFEKSKLGTNSEATQESRGAVGEQDALVSLAFGNGEESQIYDFCSGGSLATKTAWLDQLTRDYVNFTSGQSHESSERQHAEYLRATRRAKDSKLADKHDYATSTTTTDPNPDSANANDEDDGDDVDLEAIERNDEALMSFREIYGLPTSINVQAFILLQVIPILYQYLFHGPSMGNSGKDGSSASIWALEHVELQQLLAKGHKLVLMVATDLLQHINNDISIETISLLLYLYMLVQPQCSSGSDEALLKEFLQLSLGQKGQNDQNGQNSQQNGQTEVSMKPLLPWSGQLYLSSIQTELDLVLKEDVNGYETIDSSCNNPSARYSLDLTVLSESSEGPDRDQWTVDLLLRKGFELLSDLIRPSDLISSQPLLVNINALPQIVRDTFALVEPGQKEEVAVPFAVNGPKIHAKLAQLLIVLKPIAQTLITQYGERLMSTIHLTVTTIGLISSLFNAQSHLRLNKLILDLKNKNQSAGSTTEKTPEKTPTEKTPTETTTTPTETTTTPTAIPTTSTSTSTSPIPQQDLFNLQISITYNQILFNILYYLQNFQPHHAFASKILRMPLLKDLIGKSPADATRFAEALESIHFKICDLYNMCPVETIAKGV